MRRHSRGGWKSSASIQFLAHVLCEIDVLRRRDGLDGHNVDLVASGSDEQTFHAQVDRWRIFLDSAGRRRSGTGTAAVAPAALPTKCNDRPSSSVRIRGHRRQRRGLRAIVDNILGIGDDEFANVHLPEQARQLVFIAVVSIVCGRDSQKNQKVIRSIKFI
jgi:hypothetical protein